MDRIDEEFAAEAEVEQVVLKIVGVVQIDDRVVEVDDKLDWIDGIARVTEIIRVDRVVWVDDGLNQVDRVTEVTNRIDVYRVIDLS